MFESWTLKCALAMFGLVLFGSALAAPLMPANAGGGRLSTPAVRGDFAYVATGVTINTWDLSNAASPLLVSRTTETQTQGAICGLAVVGSYLYACWFNGYDAGGLAIFSISDPAHPAYAGEFDDYVATAIASGDSHLYLAGGGIGLVALDVSDALHPTAVGTGDGVGPSFVHRFKFESGKLLLSGSNAIETATLLVFDLSDADHPHVIAAQFAEFGFPSTALNGDYMIQAGQRLEVFDLRHPERPAVFSETNAFVATHALVKGEVLTLIGATGVQTWDLSVPIRPALLRTVPMALGEITDVISTPGGFLAVTLSGEGIVIDDATPSFPAFASTFVLPVGSSAAAGTMDDRYGYLAETAFGLRIVDLRTFRDVARVAIDPPDGSANRGAVDVALQGDLAFVLSSSYSLVVFDIADRAHPIEVGRLALPSFAYHISISHDRAYLAAINQLLNFLIVDIADVANMRLLGTLNGISPHDIATHGDHVFLAVEGDMEPAGLRIIDASNPTAPVIVGMYTGCDWAQGNAVDVSPDGATTYLGCYDGSLRILDTHDVTAPALVGTYMLPDEFNAVLSLEVRGDTVYAGHGFGVDEIDISDPGAPAQIERYTTPEHVSSLALSPNGSLLAFTNWAGVFYFANPAPAHVRGHGHHARPSAFPGTMSEDR